MNTLNELSKKQLEISELLEWEEEDSDEWRRLQDELYQIKGKAIDVLEYLSKILFYRTSVRLSREASAKRAYEEHKRRIARLRTAELAEDRLRDFIVEKMDDFGVDRFDSKDRSFKVTDRINYVITDAVDPYLLPASCVEILPPKILKNKINELMKNGYELHGVVTQHIKQLTVR